MTAATTALLEGKVAVVTGAGQGIGRGVALQLAQQGARVVVADINAEAGQALADGLGEGCCSAVPTSPMTPRWLPVWPWLQTATAV